MDFSRTQISGLLNNINHEKTKYITLLFKLKMLLNINKDHKLILNLINKLLLTDDPMVIYENVNYQHPLIKILMEYIAKVDMCAGGAEYFIAVVKALIDEVSCLLDNGIKPKRISNVFKDLIPTVENANMNDDDNMNVNDDINSINSINSINFIKTLIKDDHISNLLIECINNTNSYDIEKIRICKVPTGSTEDSYRMDGLIINRFPEGRITDLSNTSVGLFSCPLDIVRPELKGTILMQTHTDLLNYSKDENMKIKELIDSLNVNVLLVSGSVNDLFLEFLNSRNILVLKIFNKYDLIRICDNVGGNIYNNIEAVSGKGFVRSIKGFKDGGFKFTRIVGNSEINTIVLKNSIKEILDEKEAKIIKVLNCLKSCKSHKFNSHEFIKNLVLKVRSVDLFCESGTGIRSGKEVHSGVVAEYACRALEKVAVQEMFVSDIIKCLKYSFGFISVLLEIDDYLVAKKDQLDVKPPQHAGHWDEDH